MFKTRKMGSGDVEIVGQPPQMRDKKDVVNITGGLWLMHSVTVSKSLC